MEDNQSYRNIAVNIIGVASPFSLSPFKIIQQTEIE
jgi:hypothetical protein